MKICYTCKIEKPLSDFTKNRSKKDGLHGSCRLCKNNHQKSWYRGASSEQKERVYKRNKSLRIDYAKKLFEYLKKNPCVMCGESNPIVLEFDHLRDKTSEISTMVRCSYSWERILEEIEKCQVLCANCHRIKTAHQQNWYMLKLCALS